MLTVGSDGNLTWFTPIDTYTKTQIDEKLAAAGHLNRIIVQDIEEIENNYLNSDDYYKYIFMVPRGLEEDDDKYDEYIIIETVDSEGVSIRYIEKVGSWVVDLTEYAKKADLENYVIDPKDGSRLITSEESDKLKTLPSDAEKNVINGISTDFTIDENR
jgi:hypothetical protein